MISQFADISMVDIRPKIKIANVYSQELKKDNKLISRFIKLAHYQISTLAN
jgi:hypothetical protein